MPLRIFLLLVFLTHATAAHAIETNFLFSFGSSGSGDGEFSNPTRIAIGPAGDVYVLDAGNARIEKFDADGHFLTKWNNARDFQGSMNDLTVGPDGSVYVSCIYTLQRYSADGVYQLFWNAATTSSFSWEVTMDPAGLVSLSYQFGTSCIRKFNAGTFVSPEKCDGYYFSGTAYDAAGNVFYTSTHEGQLPRTIFKRDGSFVPVTQWEAPVDWLALDPQGNVYGVDFAGSAIRMYTNDGAPLGQFGTAGSGPGQFVQPRDVAIGKDGRIYVVDSGNHRVQVFGALPTPARTATWGRVKADYR